MNSISIALSFYATTIFSLMSIYSKTALGMGLQNQYVAFFDACAPYRKYGFRSFLGTVLSWQLSWLLSFVLTNEGKKRWWISVPLVLYAVIGVSHFFSIIGLAKSTLYS